MRYLKTVVLMLLTATFIYACGAAPQGTNISISDVGNVEGTVTDATGNPLSGVTVQIGDKSDVTGDNGVYSLQDINVGARTVTASKTGYQNHNGTCEVNKGTTVSHNIQLTANQPGDTTPPTVSSTSPANNATDIAINGAITVTFSEAMDVSTITTSTFILEQGTTPVPGTVTYSGTTATFTPSSNLSYSTSYTATITTEVKDTAGNGLTTNYRWDFTTGVEPDTTPPAVSSTSPANNATGVAVNGAITATFSENMDASSINTATFTLKEGATSIPGIVAYSGTTATFTPSSNLSYSTTYTATITTGTKDASGNAMGSSYTWSFTTGAAPDTTPPTVSSTSPASNATGVAINSTVTATFNETMDSSTVTTATFTLKQGTTSISGTVAYSGTTATFTPSSDLSYSTTYTAMITTGAKDAAGNALANSYSWSFTTANKFVALTGTYEGIANGSVFGTDDVTITISVVDSTLKISGAQFFDGTCNYSASISTDGLSVSNGTYQCSDFSSGTWTLTQMKVVDTNDVYISLLKDGSQVKKMYGMTGSSTTGTGTNQDSVNQLVGTYKGVANSTVFGTDDVTITISVVDSTLKISGAQFFDGTCNYSASISTDGLSVSNGTYQCSDFSSGTWTLTQMKTVDTNDVYISLLKDGSHVKKMYGMK